MTPTQAGIKITERVLFNSLRDDREKQTPEFQLGQLVRTPGIKKVFSIGDSSNRSYKLYTITEVIRNTIPSYRINHLPDRYIEKRLSSTNLTLDENHEVMKK